MRLKEDRRKADLKELKLKQKELELKRSGIRRLDNFFDEKRKALENLVREIREGELNKEKTLAVKKWIDDFKTELDYEHNEIKTEELKLKEKDGLEQNNDSPLQNIRSGTKVYIKSYKRNGEILRKEKKGKWLVAVDNLKLTIDPDDMEICGNQESFKLSKPVVTIVSDDESSSKTRPAFELKLLGLRAEQAEKELQNQMDLALVHGISEFAIIHGKGDGILQQLTHRFLKQNKYVKSYCFAKPEEGGSGKTIVMLG